MGRTVRARQLRTSQQECAVALSPAKALTVGMEDEMVAYWVARSKVNNPDQYKRYTDLVPGILEKSRRKFPSRGGKFKILEAPEKFHRFMLNKTPSSGNGVSFADSP